jgi:subtilase family serine protease
MRLRRSIFVAAAGFVLSISLAAHANPDQSLHTVSPWVLKARLQGPADDAQRVLITAFLSWRNPDALEKLLQDQTDPKSSRYGEFLTPDQFHAAFSPKSSDVVLVQSTLRSLGFTVEYTPDSGLFVRASGTVAQVRQAFHVTQNLYSYRGKILRAHAEEPSLPSALQGVVTHIAGLDDSRKLMRPTSRTRVQMPARVSSGSPHLPFGFPIPGPCSHYWGDSQTTLVAAKPFPYGDKLPWATCGYLPHQIREAYGANHVTETGRGVRIAITDLYASPTLVTDVNRYSVNHGLPPLTGANFRQILPANVNKVPKGDPCGATGWFAEQTLDVTAVHSMAPGASILFVAGACDEIDMADGGVALEPLYEVIDHRLADIVSDSWLYNGEADVAPGQLQSDNAQFIQAALEGMSLLFGSGDDGDLIPQGNCFGGPNPIATGSWPSTSPYVTSVGGTSLLLENASGEKSEYPWGYFYSVFQSPLISSDGKTLADQGFSAFFFSCAGGGGPSLVMAQPFYQKNVVPEHLATHTRMANGQIEIIRPARVTPDISMFADIAEGFSVGETYEISSPPVDAGCLKLTTNTEYCEQPNGGTSLATPLLAGVVALVDEARFSQGQGSAGLVNPALYRSPVGAHWYNDKPIIDITAPTHPLGSVIALLDVNNFAAFATIDSSFDGHTVIENLDTSLRGAPGYDAASGLGVPNVPPLIRALSAPNEVP